MDHRDRIELTPETEIADIRDLMSTRLWFRCADAEATTLGQLRELVRSQRLWRIKNVGRKTFEEAQNLVDRILSPEEDARESSLRQLQSIGLL